MALRQTTLPGLHRGPCCHCSRRRAGVLFWYVLASKSKYRERKAYSLGAADARDRHAVSAESILFMFVVYEMCRGGKK